MKKESPKCDNSRKLGEELMGGTDCSEVLFILNYLLFNSAPTYHKYNRIKDSSGANLALILQDTNK